MTGLFTRLRAALTSTAQPVDGQHGDSLPPVMHLPDGFAVHRIAATGLTVVDNFCTAAEANYLIQRARSRLRESRITINNRQVRDAYRTSQTAMVYDNADPDPQLVPLLHRAGMLLGLPATHVETVFVTRYGPGEYYKAHEDFYPGFDGDRLYTVLIYLNDLDDRLGGGTVFGELQVGVQPKLGRAVIWTNTNPDGSTHPETRHEAMPVLDGGEKWAIQLWFRNYALLKLPTDMAVSSPPSIALNGTETLSAGVRVLPAETGPSAPGN